MELQCLWTGQVWQKVKKKASRCDGPFICIGDFNDVASMMEKEGGRRKEKWKVNCFQEMIRACFLNDVHFQGSSFFVWC